MIEPAHRQERMADEKAMYRVMFLFFCCDIRAREESDSEDRDERMELAKRGVRVEAMLREFA